MNKLSKVTEAVRCHANGAWLLALLTGAPGSLGAALITPTDLDGLALGAMIAGPVGPEVETTFVDTTGNGIGDLSSSVSCPSGFASCVPSTNPPGALYTYQHAITPGIDLPNDPPFPSPSTVLAFDGADRFSLGFPAAGFVGIAGYSFSDADSVLVAGTSIIIEYLPDNRLEWRLSPGAGWDTGETIRFFWQTTQPPSGPGGQYTLGSTMTGTAAGPQPIPIATVPSPATFGLLASGLLGMFGIYWRAPKPIKRTEW
ncbi:hypothetical protein HW44_10825 [Nitrosococcus oceani]|nr:hypothetical protein HW44_10825 [Nitrosococcus oceani]